MWVFAVDDLSINFKKEVIKQRSGISDDSKLIDVYPIGLGSSGMYHKTNKYWEIRFIFLIIEFLFYLKKEKENLDSKSIKEWIEKICLFKKYDEEFDNFPLSKEFKSSLQVRSITMCNILCHLTFPEKYERISSDNHKRQIVETFSEIILKSDEDGKNIDEIIYLIRKKIGELNSNTSFDFYDEKIRKIWNYSFFEREFDEMQALQFKKAIILYGPPGTSKSYSAEIIAKNLINKTFFKEKNNLEKYLNEEIDFTKDRIHRLQLHQNYDYEDFIGGIKLENNSTKHFKGKLFYYCDEARKESDKNIPHVLILDEINRIDLSRMFGEFFTGLENREKPIEISNSNDKIIVPQNLFVIGTMNEIDFSIERIDFALRRRFHWFLYGFNKETLSEMLYKNNLKENTEIKEEEINNFILNVEALNIKISELPELGEQYQIGHTFFAEIVQIYKIFVNTNKYSRPPRKLFYANNTGPVGILWEISIKPIIVAFLGNLDAEDKKKTLLELENIYFYVKKQK